MSNRGDWYQGYYDVVNKEKYLGTTPPSFRSSWEKKMCNFFDLGENTIRWGFECITIPYMFDLDGRVHKYITDFYAEIKDNNGDIKRYIFEIKPLKQCSKPIPPKINNQKAMKRFMYESKQYVMNQNKWKAVTAYCKNKNIEFKVLTEKEIFNT
jgi:hypothetical protein